MTERAADLPVGSIIANDHTAWIKNTSKPEDELGNWSGTGDDMSTYDWEPQAALDAGAAVVRRGLGGAKPPADTSWITMTETKER